MADVKITELPSANLVQRGDYFYIVQNDVSKNITGANIYASIVDPIINGKVLIGTNIQGIYDSNVVSINTVRTDLYANAAANTSAIANVQLLPKALFLYNPSKPLAGKGFNLVTDTPITTVFIVTHKDGRIILNGNDPVNYVTTTDTTKPYTAFKPFPSGLRLIKGSRYIFDVSSATNSGNTILLSTVFDGSHSSGGAPYLSNVTINGTPGTAGANVEYNPPSIDIDTGGVNYLDIPNGLDGQIKIITMKDTKGGSFIITSNVYNNAGLIFKRPGDTAVLQYTGNSWTVISTFAAQFSGTTADVPEAASNLYYTNTRSRAAISAGDQTIIYDAANGTIRANVNFLANGVISVAGKTGIVTLFTTDVPEDPDPNKANTDIGFVYFTNARAEAVLTKSISLITADQNRPHANVLYVATTGNDALDGRTLANAVANIHTALSRATPWTAVKVLSGDYRLFNNPVTIPSRVALLGDDLRTTTVRPQNEYSDMFYVNNAVYVFGFTFRDHKSPSAVFSYNPDGSAGTIVTSPYVQNCSSITTTGTGMRVDGNYVRGLRSMVLDAYTQTNEGGIGVHMLNRGYTQLVSLFTICCNIGVLCESGGFCSLTNSNTSFGTYGLVADGTSPPLYYAKVIGNTKGRRFRFSNVSPMLEPPFRHLISIGDSVTFASYNKAKCERDTKLVLNDIAIDLVYSSNTQTTFSGYQYWTQAESAIPNQSVETVAAINYVKQLATRSIQNLDANIFGQPLYQTHPVLVTQYRDGSKAVSSGSTPVQDLSNNFGLVANIITNGTIGITSNIVTNMYPPRVDTDTVNAAEVLLNNRFFLQTEGVAFVNATYSGFLGTIPSGQAKCFRDIGYIVDSIYFDLLHGGNRQSTMSGVYYYRSSTAQSQLEPPVTGVTQKPQTANAFLYLKTITPYILQAIPLTQTYQMISGRTDIRSQNTTAAAAVTTAGAPEQLQINNLIDNMANIIIYGPNVAGPRLPISANVGTLTPPVAGSGYERAAKLLIANKDFIAAEVLGYVDLNWANIANGEARFFAIADRTPVTSNIQVLPGNNWIGFANIEIDTRTLFTVPDGSFASFHQASYISASGHTFEYCGSGDTLASALPSNGGLPIQENEVIERNGGAVYYTSTDHVGDFRIGNELLISRATGTINGRTFNKSLFAVMTPYILAIEQG